MGITTEIILLVLALTIDAFVATLAYGADKIKIPVKSTLIITTVCSAIIGLALLLGNLIGEYIPTKVTTGICFAILFILGSIKLFDSYLKGLVKKSAEKTKKISFKFLDFNFFLQICADSTQADKDKSKTLSAKEAISLSIALSLDGFAAGLGTGMIEPKYLQIILLSLVFNFLAVILGCLIGNKLAQKLKFNISWLSGLILIILAFLKLF